MGFINARCSFEVEQIGAVAVLLRSGTWAFVGKSDEQRAAAALASVLCVQLGPGIESEEVFKTLGPVLKKIICDGTASVQARQTVSIKI